MNCPWCFLDAPQAQTWSGSSVHTKSGLRRGMRVDVQFHHDGTGRITRSHTTQTGPEAPPGGSFQKGDWTYPSNCTDQGTGGGGGAVA